MTDNQNDSEPLPAASVVLLRQREPIGFELYMLSRPMSSRFAGGALVFPGGAVEPSDSLPSVLALCSGLSPEGAHRVFVERGSRPPRSGTAAIAFWVAAIRELFEEVGVLLATDSSGRIVSMDRPETRERYDRYRAMLQAGQTTIEEFCRAEGLCLACDRLVYFSHWITPPGLWPKRYDTRFFLARLPEGQAPAVSGDELAGGIWLHPSQALEGMATGQFQIVFPTEKHLRRFLAFSTLGELLAFAETKAAPTVLPQVREHEGRLVPYLSEELEDCW